MNSNSGGGADGVRGILGFADIVSFIFRNYIQDLERRRRSVRGGRPVGDLDAFSCRKLTSFALAAFPSDHGTGFATCAAVQSDVVVVSNDRCVLWPNDEERRACGDGLEPFRKLTVTRGVTSDLAARRTDYNSVGRAFVTTFKAWPSCGSPLLSPFRYVS